MGRRKLIYTDEFPYHIRARTNNKEWFHLDLNHCWNIFKKEINKLRDETGFNVHGFVLMSNHYHLMATATKEYDLGKIMHLLQIRLSRKINHFSGRINHVFGGTYKANLINNKYYYANCLKYLYQNPIRANIVKCCENYTFSTIHEEFQNRSALPVTKTKNNFELILPNDKSELLLWYNAIHSNENITLIKKGLKKTIFEVKADQTNKKLPKMKSSLV